eukprot:1161459-Pelagomonas_calceolata.AAC.1
MKKVYVDQEGYQQPVPDLGDESQEASFVAVEKKRKDYASHDQLRALRKGPLTSKLARASPKLCGCISNLDASDVASCLVKPKLIRGLMV